ncbi:hypothetical protein [Streptomyces albidoflavus]|uniref:hypothetical protein n=1 Tax=Streptomyces albidoflavus TaxID=1886 RepID=UPI0033C3BDB2
MSDDPAHADQLADERYGRWQLRYEGRNPPLPVPGWWPWPVDEVSFRVGDSDSGMIAVHIEPAPVPGAESGVLVRQPLGESPYAYGWPGLAWCPEDDPETPVRVHAWREDGWQWRLFVTGRPLTTEEADRVRKSVTWREAG